MPTLTVPAPTGGWNSRDSLDTMPQNDAVEMINVIPRSGFCQSRDGYLEYATGLGGEVETLAEYRSEATQTFLAAANGNIWDITSTPSSLASGFTNNRWQTVAFQDKLIFLNGSDTPQVYDGATVGAITATGPTLTKLLGGITFKGRAYYWENASQNFWYAAAGAYQGTLNSQNLGGQVTRGGNIKFITTWTRDAGDGMDDFIVFVMDTGEALVYQGSDPASASDWAKVGLFRIGSPVSTRSHTRLASEEITVTRDGYINLIAALAQGRVNDRVHIGGKIVTDAKAAIARHKANYGWEMVFWPEGNLLIINIPIATNITYHQHVMNTNNGAWCTFEGINARTWGVYDGDLYFGGNGKVYQYTGTNDDGAPIVLHVLPAFNHLGVTGVNKQLCGVALAVNVSQPSQIALVGASNYRVPNKSNAPLIPPLTGAAWDAATWDVDEWASDQGEITNNWRSVIANGVAVTFQMRLSMKNQLFRWFSSQQQFQVGGPV